MQMERTDVVASRQSQDDLMHVPVLCKVDARTVKATIGAFLVEMLIDQRLGEEPSVSQQIGIRGGIALKYVAVEVTRYTDSLGNP